MFFAHLPRNDSTLVQVVIAGKPNVLSKLLDAKPPTIVGKIVSKWRVGVADS
jgi:hypothetical protein